MIRINIVIGDKDQHSNRWPDQHSHSSQGDDKDQHSHSSQGDDKDQHSHKWQRST